jgi:FixJ family two-component response regulator
MSGLCSEIAIVDDEAPVRIALGRLLTASGYHVATFTSGEEFLKSLQKCLPDCAILDLHLPGLSGLEVQERLTQQRVPLPCILFTGKDEPGTEQSAIAAGAAGYLRKPVDQDLLLAAISSAMPGHDKSNER